MKLKCNFDFKFKNPPRVLSCIFGFEVCFFKLEFKPGVGCEFFVDHNNVLKKIDNGRKKLFEVRYVLNSIHSKVEVNQVFDENLVKDMDLALGVTTIIHKVIMKGVPTNVPLAVH